MAVISSGNQQGFTIVELVVVIVLLGILSVTVLPRFFDIGGYRDRAAYDEVAGAVRYAQKLAVASGCQVRVEITGSDYKVQLCEIVAGDECPDGILTFCPIADFLLLNNESWNSGHPVDTGPEEDVNLNATPSSFIFDAMGRCTNKTVPVPVEVTVGAGVDGRSISVVGETGYVDAP